MGMILPPGFIINTAETYAEVATYDLVPLDKIYGYWRGTVSPSSLMFRPSDSLG